MRYPASLLRTAGEAIQKSRLKRWIASSFALLAMTVMAASPAFAACSSPAGAAGENYYNTTDNIWQYCDGTNWIDYNIPHSGAGSGGCSSPSAPEGALDYDQTDQVLRFCEGDAWIDTATPWTFYAYNFDGTNDYLTRGADYTGIADSKQWTVSFWFRRTRSSTLEVITLGAGARYMAQFLADDRLQFHGKNQAGDTVYLNVFSSTYFTDTNWHHALFSADLSTGGSARLYIDGVDDSPTIATYSNNAVAFSRSEHAIGASTTAADKFQGDLAELWLDFGTYIDFSNASNRQKFIDSNGDPVFLGKDGSLPTGSAPEVFLSGYADAWHTNKGTGGGFTLNGALTSAAEPASMVLHLKMDDTSGTTAVDASGNGNNGTMIGGMSASNDSVPGVIGTALDFDGTDDSITVSSLNDTNFPQDGSLSFWVKADIAGQSQEQVFDRYQNTRNHVFVRTCDTGVCAGVPTVGYQIAFQKTSAGYVFIDNIETPDSQWNHFVVAWDTTNDMGYIYLNGSLSYSNSITDAAWIPDGQHVYLASTESSANPFAGQLDDVRIYNHVLSSTEVQALYEESSLNADVVGWWKLDETSGTSATDSSKSGNNGTLQGGMDFSNDSASGVKDKALNFDGTSGAVNMGDPADGSLDMGTSDFTTTAWIRVNNFDYASSPHVFNKRGTGAGVGFYVRMKSTGQLQSYIRDVDDASQDTWQSTSSTYVDGDWHHMAITWDRDGVATYYIDGTADGTNNIAASGASLDNSYDFVVGAAASTTEVFDGEIDDARIYKRLLTAAEIQKLYGCTAPAYIEGTILYDSSNGSMDYCKGSDWISIGK